MVPLKSTVLTILLLMQMGCVVVIGQTVPWTSDLSGLLTNTGLREDIPVGTVLGMIGITGVPTNIVHISYSSNSSYFIVNETSGEVRLNAPLSYRLISSFDVTFFAKDATQGFSDQRIVTVNVKGVNHAPYFDVPVYQVSVKDNVPVGNTFYSYIYFTDIDTGPNGTVTLTCNPSSPEEVLACSTFALTMQDVPGKETSYLGNVSTATQLNYLSNRKYTLPLLIQDGGTPKLSATATLIVNIESQFNNQPVFVNSPILLAVNESAPSTTDFGFVQARTGNINRTMPLGMIISDDAKHWFYLENTTFDSSVNIYSARIRTYGNISRALLPSNQYSFEVTAAELSVDGQMTAVASKTTVQVFVSDINTFAPTFSLASYVVSVAEGLGVGAVIPGLSMEVNDKDQGDNSFFVIELTRVMPSPVADIFLVQPSSAEGSASVYLIANKPDYLVYSDPNKRQYTILITARETKTAQLYSGTTNVTINILSRNNNPPIFTRSEYLASLVDNQPVGTTITDQIQANDPDSGDAGNIKYIISSGNDNSYFTIDSSRATIRLGRTLKYNATGPSVVLTILATDGTGLNATTTLRIQIIDSTYQGPQFSPSFIDSFVVENQVDLRPPVLFFATPLQKDRVTMYRIVGGDQSLFNLTVIHPLDPTKQDSGVITMNRGVDYNETPDRKGVFQVIVQASSGSSDPLTTNLTINIYVQDTNNHAPIFSPTTYSTEITEITPEETPLLTVNSTDLDAPNSNNARIHYIISSGSRDNFVVDYTTGLIKIASHPDLSIDRFGDQYNITVLAVDEGSPPNTGTATVYIKVKDSVYRSPLFSSQLYTFYVSESTIVNTLVGITPATSPDRRAVLSYSIRPGSITAKDKNGQPVLSSNGNYNYNTSFVISNQNASLVVNAPLSYDYFVRTDFQVQAVVTNPEINGTIPPAIANVTIFILQTAQISDTVTFLDPANRYVYVSIYNNLPANTQLYQLSAFHVATQLGITRFNYTASIPSSAGYINVNYQTGRITLAQSLANLNLVLPMNFTYEVTAYANPPSNASEKATVVVNVKDVNADIPVFYQAVYNFTIYNNVTPGNLVGKIDAKAPGSQQNPILYTLQGFNSEAFYIDNRTGQIFVNQPDLVNRMLIFALSGQASSGNTPKTQVVVYINVIHFYNLKPPQFSQSEYTLYTLDRTPVNSIIGQVNAIDPDSYHTSTINYTTTGNGTEYFQLDPVSGTIQTRKPLLHSPFPYVLTVTATSSGVPMQSSVVVVKIVVANVSADSGIGFYVPQTDHETYYAYVNRSNYPIVTVLGYSTRPGASLTYNISTPGYDGPGNFIINPLTGELTTNGTLKFDPNNRMQTVCMTMTDNVTPRLDVTLCSNVVFVSDQPPSFDLCVGLNSSLQANVLENLDAGSYVTTVKACSLDKPPLNTDMIYQITDGNMPRDCYGGKAPFVIDPVSGNITTAVRLLWNCTNTVTLNVTVSFANGTKAVNGSTKQVVITVEPTDSSGPTFENNLPGTCRGAGIDVTDGILDFTPPGTDFIQMYAGDCDAPQYGKHNYTISSDGISFIVPGDSTSVTKVPGAFVINRVTGFIMTNLPDYRQYSRGYFQMTIVATDDKMRSATAKLTVFIVREGQRIKFVFGKTPNDVKAFASDFLAGTNYFLSLYNTQTAAYSPELSTHIDKNAYYYFNETDICFEVIRRNNMPEVLPASEAISLFPNNSHNQWDYIMNGYYKNFSVIAGPQNCYVKTTTHWWSGYWFLWWLLIALGLFIFVIALLLNILACCFWPMYTRGFIKSRPYIVLDEPPTTSPVSDFEWQESMHRIN